MTLFILDIKKESQKWPIKKSIFTYIALTILTIAVNKIYGIFGHGVSSNSMTWMFLYPAIGGFLLFTLIGIFLPNIYRFTGYRIFFNLHNSGIALLTLGSFLKGVFDIAGTGSTYLSVYSVAGWLFITFGLAVLSILIVNYKRVATHEYKHFAQSHE